MENGYNGAMREGANRWLLLGAVVLLAGVRWFVMTSPGHFQPWQPDAWFDPEVIEFTRLNLNLGCSLLCLVVGPWVVLSWLGGVRPGRGEWGLGSPDMNEKKLKLRVVALGVLFVGAGVLGTLGLPELGANYPLGRIPGGGYGTVVAGIAGSVALVFINELFFRGVALFTLEKGFGVIAVYMLLPLYVVEYAGAPTVELWAAVFRGVVLGHLALRTRSMWPGFWLAVAGSLSVDGVGLLAR